VRNILILLSLNEMDNKLTEIHHLVKNEDCSKDQQEEITRITNILLPALSGPDSNINNYGLNNEKKSYIEKNYNKLNYDNIDNFK